MQPMSLQLLILIMLFGVSAPNLKVWAQEIGEPEVNLDGEVLLPEAGVSEEPTPLLDSGPVPEDLPPPDESLNEEGWVEVEPSNLVPSDLTSSFYLVPYRIRRTRWGVNFSVSYSTFEPTYYSPNFVEAGYSDVYSSPETPLLEFQMGVKYNFKLGSLVAEAGVGTFKEVSDSDIVESELSLMPIRLGLTYIMDTLFIEPYLAPYVTGGVYTISYTESLENTSNNGFTQAAPYFTAGIQFQLDWIDKIAAREAYLDSGIENTFLFVEGRKFFASAAPADPNFETDFHVNGGLRLEF